MYESQKPDDPSSTKKKPKKDKKTDPPGEEYTHDAEHEESEGDEAEQAGKGPKKLSSAQCADSFVYLYALEQSSKFTTVPLFRMGTRHAANKSLY